MRRLPALMLAMLSVIALSACTPKPVQHGMQTADGVTAMVSTLTEGETVTVTVTLTNGGGSLLWLTAPELTDGSHTTAHYLQLSLDGSAGARSGLRETGEMRRMRLDGRESYVESCTFEAVSLPAVLTVSLCKADSMDGPFAETTLTFPLK